MSATAVGRDDHDDSVRLDRRSVPLTAVGRWAPVIAAAQTTRLADADQLEFSRVASRMFLHVVAGTGSVEVNRTRFELEPPPSSGCRGCIRSVTGPTRGTHW
ncbi:hypothetical protein [Microlunatus parietis]|uniref:Uncharacterized protein n=1 Tax=Microlunatus parietis TaxID=682979 RepID=A0A7Y9I8S3_9ACTN|nr:hypothetical protein [Microlunatus parietis]NYE72408.1 hypothetical protein [Microlunatus parietis]